MKTPNLTAPRLHLRPFARALELFLCLLLSLLALPLRADLDTDGDGLTDDEEAIYRTNPLVADTDGDGVVDGLEVQMKTNPLDRNSVLKMLPLMRVPGAGMLVPWRSVAGQTYLVQMADPSRPGSGGALSWSTLATVTANSAAASFEDRTPGPASRLYRVTPLLNAANDTLPPIVSVIQALPPGPPPSLPVATLSVIAQDLVGVTRVDLLDGNTVLGTARRGAGNAWNFSWSLNNANLNGRHYLRARALDAAGNAGYSPVLAFDVSLGAPSCVTVGQVRICADQIQPNGPGGFAISGNIRMNGITLTANSTLTTSSLAISGTGGVVVPGLGMVANGAFDVNASTGTLTVRSGALGFGFSANMTFTPTVLSINVISNSIGGSGSVSLRVNNHTLGPVNFSGTVSYLPLAGTVTVNGSMAMQGFSGAGKAVLQLHDSTFTLTGDARFQSSDGDVYTVNNGVARLAYALAVPTISVSGKLGLPDGLSLQVQGYIAASGEIKMSGAGSGPIGDYKFNPISGSLYRAPGLNSLVTVSFRGQLVHPTLSNYWLDGTVRSNGDIDIHGRGNVYTNGVVLNPFGIHAVGNVSNHTVVVTVDGTLRVNYLQPVQFNGIVRPDGSIEMNAQSGPYNAAWFNGVVPRMDDPSLTFEQQVFVGCYQLCNRDPGLETRFQLNYTRTADSAGGIQTLTLTAVTTRPGITAALTLTGTMSSTGAATLSGSFYGELTEIWGYSTANLACAVSRTPNGVVTFNITGGVLNYGLLSGSSTQTSGAISSDGSGFIQFNYSSATLNGFALQNVTVRLAQTAAGARSLTLNASLTVGGSKVAGFMAPATFSISGNLNSNGTFSLPGFASGPLALSGLAASSVANATVTLTQAGLTLQGSFSGGLFTNVGLASASLTAAITVNGSMTLSGTITVPPITAGMISVRSAVKGGAMSATLTPNGLSFSGATLTVSGFFSNSIPIGPFIIDAQGELRVFVDAGTPPGFNLNGYGMTKVSFWLDRRAGVLSLQPFTASLSIPGFSQQFTGSVDSAGNFALDADGSLRLGGFTTLNNGHLTLRNSGLRASGSLSLTVSGVTLGSVPFDIAVSSTGSYSDTLRSQTTLSIGSYLASFAALELSSTGLRGDATVTIGKKAYSLPGVNITPASLSGSANFPIDSNWKRFLDAPIPVPGDSNTGDVYGRVQGSVTITLAGSSLTLNYSVSFAWWVVTWQCDAAKCIWVDPPGYWEPVYVFGVHVSDVWVDPPGFWQCDPPVCYSVFAPVNINDPVLDAQRLTRSGTIGSNGVLSLTESHAGVGSWSWGPLW